MRVTRYGSGTCCHEPYIGLGKNELSASELGKHARIVAPARVIPGKSGMLSPIHSARLRHELKRYLHHLPNQPITDRRRGKAEVGHRVANGGGKIGVRR